MSNKLKILVIKLIIQVLGLISIVCGFIWLSNLTSWKVSVCIFLILLGNNIGTDRKFKANED